MHRWTWVTAEPRGAGEGDGDPEAHLVVSSLRTRPRSEADGTTARHWPMGFRCSVARASEQTKNESRAEVPRLAREQEVAGGGGVKPSCPPTQLGPRQTPIGVRPGAGWPRHSPVPQEPII